MSSVTPIFYYQIVINMTRCNFLQSLKKFYLKFSKILLLKVSGNRQSFGLLLPVLHIQYLGSRNVMGNSFVLFDVSIVIPHGQFHCGNRGHTQNTDFLWVKSHFPVGKSSSETATNITCARLDMNFIFSCSTRYLIRSLRLLVKFISPRGHVIYSIYRDILMMAFLTTFR